MPYTNILEVSVTYTCTKLYMYFVYLYIHIHFQLSQPHCVHPKKSDILEITIYAKLQDHHFNVTLELLLILVINELICQGRDILLSVRYL